MTDEKPELAELLDEDFENMVAGMAHSYANNPGNQGLPLIAAEDLCGEGMLATIKAYESFDPDRGNFKTYAYVYINRAMQAYCMRSRYPLSSSSHDRRVRLEDVHKANSGIVDVEKIDIPHEPPHQDGIDLEEFFLAGLDQVNRDIVTDRFIHGMTFKEIGEKYDMSTSGAQVRINKLQSQLERRARKYESYN